MIMTVRQTLANRPWWMWAGVAIVLASAVYFGYQASMRWLFILGGMISAALVLRYPLLGLLVLSVASLVGKIEVGTGTEVSLNPVALIAPVLLVIWLLVGLRRKNLSLVPSRTNRPLMLFLVVGLLSIAIGNATWDPQVPRSDRLIIVQLAQWAIFAFSAGIYWFVGNMVKDESWLRRLTACYLIVGGTLSIIRAFPGGTGVADPLATYAIYLAPFVLLMTGLAVGQLLFNQNLSTAWRVFLLAIIGSVLVFAFGQGQERASTWVGVTTTVATILWLRFPRMRWLAVTTIAILTVTGVLFSAVYDFAGGDAKWSESGASREVLIGRVLELSMRNPITGLGPAAYRSYGFTKPLYYNGALWLEPKLNSHNNYVDLFSQVGLVGLGIFLWFMLEFVSIGWRLRSSFRDGFTGGYLAGMIGAWVGVMAIMALADWFLPFVYNIGFQGFQASLPIWMFFGGIVTLEQIARDPNVSQGSAK